MSTDSPYEINGYSLEAIRNRNEIRVVQQLREMLPEIREACGCRICVEDIYAATLSRLPNHYTQVGSIVVKPQPTDEEVAVELRWAVERVRANPSHPRDA